MSNKRIYAVCVGSNTGSNINIWCYLRYSRLIIFGSSWRRNLLMVGGSCRLRQRYWPATTGWRICLYNMWLLSIQWHLEEVRARGNEQLINISAWSLFHFIAVQLIIVHRPAFLDQTQIFSRHQPMWLVFCEWEHMQRCQRSRRQFCRIRRSQRFVFLICWYSEYLCVYAYNAMCDTSGDCRKQQHNLFLTVYFYIFVLIQRSFRNDDG